VAAVAVDVADHAATTLGTLRVQAGSLAMLEAGADPGAPPGASAVGVVAPGAGPSELVVRAGDLDPALAATQEVVAAAGTARDDGRAVLAAPAPAPAADGADGAASVLVVPVYEVDGDRATELPGATTAQRRAAWAGAVLLPLDVATLLGEADVRVLDGDQVLGRAGEGGEADGETAAVTIPVGSRRWVVQIPATSVGTPPLAVVVLVLGATAAALTVLLQLSAQALSRRAAARAEARTRQAGTMRRVAPVLQQSPDLGDVLPAVAVLLEEELHIDGFALSTYGNDGTERELFVSGLAIDRRVRPDDGATELPTGQTLALKLRRAERDVAIIRLRAARRLGSLELESLRASAELLAAALSTAQAHERQEAAMVALREVDDLKNVFLGVASHELRTPVTAIGGFARLLAERWDQLPEDQRRMLAMRIQANAASLGVLVQDLLDFSRLERGRFVVESEPVELATVLEAVVDRLAPVWAGRAIVVDPEARPVVAGDRDALERVVANLLSNAVKFSPEGSEVVASVAVDGPTAVLRVDDAGPGVPEDERAHIYSAFFRGRGDAIVRTRGAGIGLSVVKEVVAQMGGSISVDTSPMGGARFEVRLPLADSDRDLDDVVAAGEAAR
jgi:signal transduction histidine kinase